MLDFHVGYAVDIPSWSKNATTGTCILHLILGLSIVADEVIYISNNEILTMTYVRFQGIVAVMDVLIRSTTS
jgi:hypothetical protein